jgi:hypothetical protein
MIGGMKRYHVKTLPYSIQKKHPNSFDEEDVLMSKVPYTQEYHYHATAIASYVIDTGDKNNLQWLLENMASDGAIYHNFTFPFYPMKKGWVGGLAQGLTASALAYNGYKEESKLAVEAMKKYCDNGLCILEYPDIEILNGWMYALFGIYDSGNVSYFKENIEKIKKRIFFFNLGNWSKYDSFYQYPSTPFYHGVHLQQLKELYRLTNEDIFKEYHTKWSRYSHSTIIKNNIKRNMKITKHHGLVGTYKIYKKRKRWMNESSSSM